MIGESSWFPFDVFSEGEEIGSSRVTPAVDCSSCHGVVVVE